MIAPADGGRCIRGGFILCPHFCEARDLMICQLHPPIHPRGGSEIERPPSVLQLRASRGVIGGQLGCRVSRPIIRRLLLTNFCLVRFSNVLQFRARNRLGKRINVAVLAHDCSSPRKASPVN